MANKEIAAITIRQENLQSMIFTVRGAQVMIDRDLASIYPGRKQALERTS